MEINVTYVNVRQMQAALVAIEIVLELLQDDQLTHAQRRRIEWTVKALAHAGLKHSGVPLADLSVIPF